MIDLDLEVLEPRKAPEALGVGPFESGHVSGWGLGTRLHKQNN